MSWGTCYNNQCKSGSNNIHFDYPPLMSDSRNYTNWTPACRINQKFFQKQGIRSNFQYRQYLINNANSIMKKNFNNACDNCGVCSYGTPLEKGNENKNEFKYLYKSCRDATRPYGYEDSDMKNLYLSRQELQSQLSAPYMSQESYLYNNACNENR